MTARAAVAAMTAYTLEVREAETKLNQNESPFDFPAELKREVLERLAKRPWNLYPDFESSMLRNALAETHALAPENIVVGNGSNELLAAAIGAFVGPGTPVVIPRPTFALYEKLVTIAGGLVVPIEIDPESGLLPLDAMLDAIATLDGAIVIVCSPNNPTGGVLPVGGLAELLAAGATVLFDRAYGDFERRAPASSEEWVDSQSPLSAARGEGGLRAERVLVNGTSKEPLTLSLSPRGGERGLGATSSSHSSTPLSVGGPKDRLATTLPPLHDRLVTLSTFSKAWGLAGLRAGWLASTAATCAEVRKVKLPYSINILSETIAALALGRPEIRDGNVARVIAERDRIAAAMRTIPGITPFPSAANFIAFRLDRTDAEDAFEALYRRGVLVRNLASAPRMTNCLRVSIGTREQNDRFLTALREVV